MTREVRERAFEPFFSTKGKEGTGLGLASVYGIVEQIGGHIWLSTEPGRGTTFNIYLREVAGAASEPDTPAASVARRPLNILLVEDQDAERELALATLEGAGHTVVAASSGELALVHIAAASRMIDVVVTDLMLPGISGLELAQQAREARPGLSTVVMTGYAGGRADQPDDTPRELTFLTKPFRMRALLDAVDNAFARRPR